MAASVACNALTGASDLGVGACEDCAPAASGDDAGAGGPGEPPVGGEGGGSPDAAVDGASVVPETPGGFLDATFGTGGIVVSTLATEGLAVRPRADGRLYVAGTFNEPVVLRFTPAGAPDTSFGGNGRAGTGTGLRYAGFALGGATERPILLGEIDTADGEGTITTWPALVRLDDGGGRDGSFGSGFFGPGTAQGTPGDEYVTAVAASGGGVVVVGRDGSAAFPRRTAFWRFGANGGLDGTFGSGGKQTVRVSTGSAEDLPLAASSGAGAIVAAGQVGSAVDMAVARISANGAVDAAFAGGKATVSIGTAASGEKATAVAVAPSGDVVVAGEAPMGAAPTRSPVFGLARFTSAGALDPAFGAGGKLTLSFATPGATYAAQSDLARAVFVDPKGRILVVGHASERAQGAKDTVSRVVLARLRPNGAPDPLFGQGGTLTFRFDIAQNDSIVSGAAMDPSGRLVVVGRSGNRLALARITL